MTDRKRLRIIEEWTGHRKPRNLPMQFARCCLIALAIALIGFLLTCCTVETVTTRETSAKGAVVETVRTTKKADAASWALAGAVVEAYSPPPARRIREEKSGRRTAGEIANRWKAEQ